MVNPKYDFPRKTTYFQHKSLLQNKSRGTYVRLFHSKLLYIIMKMEVNKLFPICSVASCTWIIFLCHVLGKEATRAVSRDSHY